MYSRFLSTKRKSIKGPKGFSCLIQYIRHSLQGKRIILERSSVFPIKFTVIPRTVVRGNKYFFCNYNWGKAIIRWRQLIQILLTRTFALNTYIFLFSHWQKQKMVTSHKLSIGFISVLKWFLDSFSRAVSLASGELESFWSLFRALTWGIRTAIKSKNDHAFKIGYLKCTHNLNSNSKNEAFSLNISRENEGQSWYLRALFWKYL